MSEAIVKRIQLRLDLLYKHIEIEIKLMSDARMAKERGMVEMRPYKRRWKEKTKEQ